MAYHNLLKFNLERLLNYVSNIDLKRINSDKISNINIDILNIKKHIENEYYKILLNDENHKFLLKQKQNKQKNIKKTIKKNNICK